MRFVPRSDCIAVDEHVHPVTRSVLTLVYASLSPISIFLSLFFFLLPPLSLSFFTINFIKHKQCIKVAVVLRRSPHMIRPLMTPIRQQFHHHHHPFEPKSVDHSVVPAASSSCQDDSSVLTPTFPSLR